MPKLFNHFAEIEQEVIEAVPPITYKYRQWSEPNHQSILTKNGIWFTHPKELNDPYDIRVPVRFDYSEIDKPEFFEVLKMQTQIRFPQFPPKSREFRVVCDNKLDIIKENPQKHFEENYLELRESDLYDRIGVFSLTSDCLNETMWAHYGNNAKGFCIGFDTVDLLKKAPGGFGFVDYEKDPPLHSFIRPISENQKDEMYLKNTKWEYEKEFRLLTFRVKSDKDRLFNFNPAIIKEIVLGSLISNEDRNEIIEILKKKYKSKVRLFICKASASSYSLQREEIDLKAQ